MAGRRNDTISSNGGNDVLFGGPGIDTLNGGAATDVCLADATDVRTSCP